MANYNNMLIVNRNQDQSCHHLVDLNLKTLVWHLSKVPMKEMSSLKQEGQDGPGSLS